MDVSKIEILCYFIDIYILSLHSIHDRKYYVDLKKRLLERHSYQTMTLVDFKMVQDLLENEIPSISIDLLNLNGTERKCRS